MYRNSDCMLNSRQNYPFLNFQELLIQELFNIKATDHFQFFFRRNYCLKDILT